MLRFYADAFAAACGQLGLAITGIAVRAMGTDGGFRVKSEKNSTVAKETREALASFGAVCQRDKLPLSATFHEKVGRAIQKVNLDRADTAMVCMSLITELQFDMVSELRGQVFLSVHPSRRSHYIDNGSTFGAEVEAAFPETTAEIKSANRCFALDEWTACVFHLMRALEIALHKLAKQLGVSQFSSIELENWKNILDAAEKKIKALEQQPKSPSKDAELQYYGETMAHYRSTKDAWRNHVAHARTNYDEGQAMSILNHVREFMALLAARP